MATRPPTESDQDYALFIAFRDSAYPDGVEGPFIGRNLASFADEYKGQAIHLVSTRYKWRQRCKDYDNQIEEAKTSVSITEAMEVRRNQLGRIKKLSNIVHAELEKLEHLIETQGSGIFSVKDLITFCQYLEKAENLLTGDVTDRIAVLSNSYDLERLTLEELEALHSLQKKMRA